MFFATNQSIFRLTIKQLVKGLGDQFDLPEKKIEKLNLETLVQNAIKVESGEIAPFRVGLFYSCDNSYNLYFNSELFIIFQKVTLSLK